VRTRPDDRPVLRGPRVTLRPPRPADVADRLAAGRDPEFRRMVGADAAAPAPFTRADAERWYARLAAEPHGWVVEHEGRCVGLARLHGVEPAARRAWVALGLFAPEDRGRGLGTEALRLVLAHAFDGLGLVVVRLRVLAHNARALACYRRCGFGEVGREPVTVGGERTEDVTMALHASVPALWRGFLASGLAPPGLDRAPISAWHFCDAQPDADLCAALVLAGRKRATAPSAWSFAARGEPLPRVGEHHVVTTWAGVARCVIRTTDVRVVPFDAVDAAHAAAEGEGDGSLAAWRRTHWAYYARELAGTGYVRRRDMPIVCERFVVAYPPPTG
jgi:uncharacterized protein YhfF/RimJ/RimL family protein N-acetyltransferase